MNIEHVILSFETATRNSSLAVLRGEKVLAEWHGDEHFVQSEGLLFEIEKLLKIVNIDFSEIGLLAVVKGPGSFSGLRVGLATAKGFAMAGKIPAIGVTTFETCAAANNADGMNFVVLSAGRGNVFAQSFEVNIENKVIAARDEPQHVALETIKGQIIQASIENKIVHVIAAREILADISNLSSEVVKISEPHQNLAASAGKIALRRYLENTESSTDLKPLYLRPVDIGKPKTS